MTQDMNREERLWNYIDGTATPAERSLVEDLLAKDAEWKAAYGQLLEIQAALHNAELESPSMRFTQNVMDEIARTNISPAINRYINKRIVWGIGGFMILMVLGFIIYGLGQADWTTSDKQSWMDKLGSVNVGELFSNTAVNIFMMVNVVIGLVLFDAYLSVKRKKYQRH